MATNSGTKNVVGLFDNQSDAESAVRDLISAGFAREHISLVTTDPEGKLSKQQVDQHGNLAGEGAVSGLTSGAVVGGVLGLLIGAGALAFPAIGLVAIGPLAGALTGAGIGAASGGIIGGLIGLGIPEDESHTYAESIRRGGVLVALQTDGARADEAARILDRHNAIDVDERREAYQREGFSRYDEKATPYTDEQITTERARYQAPVTTTSEATTNQVTTNQAATPRNINEGETLEVVRENIDVMKREERSGGVRVRSYVTERPVTEQVTLRDEHVNVERRPVDRPVDASALNTFREGEIEVTETHERPVVTKEARVVEEISINKTVDQRTETITDTVRETHVDVERIGEADYGHFEQDYNTRYASTAASTGSTYEHYRPAYEYGLRAHSHERYSGKGWDAIQADMRREWETTNGNTWDKFKDAVQAGWSRAQANRTGGNNQARMM